MNNKQAEFGVIGLGTMGRNLMLNMGDHGFTVVGFDKNAEQAERLSEAATNDHVYATQDLKQFISALKIPRAIILLVPAGSIVDSVIKELQPYLAADDLLMDWGNSHYKDTALRMEALIKDNIHFMGIGISGGETGARYGPSIMPGGSIEAYQRIEKMLVAVSAKINGEPCVKYIGKGASGHYVKMVHNGIEYGIMQLIAEAYHVLKSIGGLTNKEIQQVFYKWNKGRLQSFLIEITANIFLQKDEIADGMQIDTILDTAAQKGTGKWTCQDALDLHLPVPTIDAAVTARELSALKLEREIVSKKISGPQINVVAEGQKSEVIDQVEKALFFSVIIAYLQGMSLLSRASIEYKFEVELKNIATIWRGGCIIRAALLEDIRAAFEKNPALTNLLLDEGMAAKLMQSQKGIRATIQHAVQNGIPTLAMMASLAYFDSYRSSRLPANLTQAQRDFFGAHTYERIDRQGIFHTQWEQTKS